MRPTMPTHKLLGSSAGIGQGAGTGSPFGPLRDRSIASEVNTAHKTYFKWPFAMPASARPLFSALWGRHVIPPLYVYFVSYPPPADR